MAEPDFFVQSASTQIGVFADGDGGLPVVMVHGSIADHAVFDGLVAAGASSLQAFRLDRRGFGVSGDGPDYAIERDFDDVAAVVDAVAQMTGTPVALFGHSYGANCAIGGAVASDNVSHLVVYEPSLGLRYPAGCIESIEDALGRGDRDAAIVAVLSTMLEMTRDEIDEYRQSPVWPDRLRAAHTVPRECRVEQAQTFAATNWQVGCPTLVLAGSETTDDLATIAADAAHAVDGAQLRVLDGYDHMAPRSAPAVVVEQLIDFMHG